MIQPNNPQRLQASNQPFQAKNQIFQTNNRPFQTNNQPFQANHQPYQSNNPINNQPQHIRYVAKTNSQGLPSIGDSRFLETIIDFQFAAQQMTESLINQYGSTADMNGADLSKLLGRIFCLMKTKQNSFSLFSEKKSIMHDVMSILKGMNARIKGHPQENIIQTIGSIISQISNKHPEFKTLFEQKQVSSCTKCISSTKDRLISYSEHCKEGCIDSIKRNMSNPPKYIIYSNYNQKSLENVIKEQGEDAVCTYQCKAKLFYKDGNYFMQRWHQGTWSQFTDTSIRPLDENMPQYHKKDGLVLLYEFVKKEALTPSIITERKLLSLAINDGFNLAFYRENKERYKAYSRQKPPALLECGHFTCEECHQGFNKKCAFCNEKKEIKYRNYFKIQQIERAQMGDKTPKSFRFNVTTKAGSFQSDTLSGDIPFREIMDYMPNFDDYNRVSNYSLNIVLNGASFPYERIEKILLKDFNEFLRVLNKQSAFLFDSTQKRVNSITVLPRTDGGR